MDANEPVAPDPLCTAPGLFGAHRTVTAAQSDGALRNGHYLAKLHRKLKCNFRERCRQQRAGSWLKDSQTETPHDAADIMQNDNRQTPMTSGNWNVSLAYAL